MFGDMFGRLQGRLGDVFRNVLREAKIERVGVQRVLRRHRLLRPVGRDACAEGDAVARGPTRFPVSDSGVP